MLDQRRSEPIRILIVIGTRPEAIKLAPVVLSLRQHPQVDLKVCSTGQHRELLKPMLHLFGIVPDVLLDVMRAGQSLDNLTGAILGGVGRAIGDLRPDWVVIQGDTNTAFAAALAAVYRRVPVAHVEAGLRTGNLAAPFPEEINRRLIASLGSLHFAPTDTARDNLVREGIPEASIHITGNTIVDALQYVRTLAIGREATHEGGTRRPIVLATCHRRENGGARLRGICTAMLRLADRGDVDIVYILHGNPDSRVATNLLQHHPRITVSEPLDYISFISLLDRSYIVLTDSGGIQEEAPYLGKPVLVLRETTERLEGVAQGCTKLVGVDPDAIVYAVGILLESSVRYAEMALARTPYGDGLAAPRIATALLDHPSPRQMARPDGD